MERHEVDARALERDLDTSRLEHLAEERQAHTVAEDQRQVPGARDVTRGGEAVRVGEVCVRGAERARLLVHARRERRR